jgi:hypothetical protein
VIRETDGLTVHLHPSATRSLGNTDGILFVERLPDDAGGRTGFRVHKAQPRAQRRDNPNTISASAADDLRMLSGHSSLIPGGILNQLLVGSLVAYDVNLGIVVDLWVPSYSWQAVDVRVLQDRSGGRTLLVPVGLGGALSLQGGDYRLTFVLDRARWSTTAAADSSNHYHAEKTLSLSW